MPASTRKNPYRVHPLAGRVTMWHAPAAPACAWIPTPTTTYFVPPNYDSMIGKIIVHGDTRGRHCMAACARHCLETVVEGISTNVPLHQG